MAVYFIKHGDYIKIGKSVDPWKRLASLQTAHHDTLEMLAIMPGNEELEYGLHRAFGQHMERGEWFKINDRLLAFIEMVRVTFPDVQRNLNQEDLVASKKMKQGDEGAENAYDKDTGLFIALDSNKILELGESTTFRMTHKGHYRSPTVSPFRFWDSQLFYYGGYWKGYESDNWYVLNAPGLRFDFADMQHVTVTRYGEIHTGEQPPYTTVQHSLEGMLNSTLKEAVYNRKNSGHWLGLYNDKEDGIVVAVRREPYEQFVRLDVPEEVIDYWRQYRHPSPLPKGVSIEA